MKILLNLKSVQRMIVPKEIHKAIMTRSDKIYLTHKTSK